jgi:two-component system sensor histidine kinase SenX3
VGEAALKDLLADQLRLIGQQIADLHRAENTEQMWKITERLDPEKRVAEDLPVEEVVEEYRMAVEAARAWMRERAIPISFDEYSYFYDAIFQLTAESVRRYEQHQDQAIARTRGEYLAGVMHQLRAPLSALAVQVEVLSRLPAPPAPPALARLRRNLRRMSFLVNGVLRVERYRPDETPLKPQAILLAGLIDDIIADHDHDATTKRLRLEAHIDRSLQLEVDPDLFTDVVGNFVQNAIKFTNAGFVLVEADASCNEVTVRVRDSGPGIDRERRATIFKDVQAGSGGGAGIGLQIAKHAAAAQGGSVGVDSEPGRGSIFWLRLPRRVPPRS